MKTCTKCNTEKEEVEFHRQSAAKDGFNPWCKLCAKAAHAEWRLNNRPKCRQYSREWSQKNPKKVRQIVDKWRVDNPQEAKTGYRRAVLKKYNISIAQYNEMHEQQNGLCAICNKPEERVRSTTSAAHHLAVDHDHTTGAIRALLCTGCNLALGNFKEDPEVMRRAADYIEHYKAQRNQQV